MANKLTYRNYLQIFSTCLITICGILIIVKNYLNPFAFFLGGLFLAFGLYRLNFIYRYFKGGGGNKA